MERVQNPFNNTSNELVAKRAKTSDEYLSRLIKDKKILGTVKQIISLREYAAFERGVELGRANFSLALREMVEFATKEGF